MGWAARHIEKLEAGEAVQFRPRESSMRSKVGSGDLVTVEPVEPERLETDDIVLCRVKGHDYLHLVKAMKDGRFLIGNNRGGTNGWISASGIFGKCTKVEP